MAGDVLAEPGAGGGPGAEHLAASPQALNSFICLSLNTLDLAVHV